jgi:hypothetical protein
VGAAPTVGGSKAHGSPSSPRGPELAAMRRSAAESSSSRRGMRAAGQCTRANASMRAWLASLQLPAAAARRLSQPRSAHRDLLGARQRRVGGGVQPHRVQRGQQVGRRLQGAQHTVHFAVRRGSERSSYMPWHGAPCP